ncbi:MAG: hypothetical protein ACFCUT_01345 [Kiloniellaceae bacterium]
MLDKFIGFAAMAVLIGFMGILVGFVPSLDLIAVTVVVVVLAGCDFYYMMFIKKNGNGGR